MKSLFLLFALFASVNSNSQSCEELMEYVKSKSYGSTYSSYTSDAIQKVTFYDVMIDYKTHYFAVVCFKRKYSYELKSAARILLQKKDEYNEIEDED